MGEGFGLMIHRDLSLCFIGSELRLLWFWADVSVSFPARMALADGYPKDFPAQE